MDPGSFRFDRFHLDCVNRRLTRDTMPVEINARYLDALGLLVREQGKLVSKERFLAEIWRGVPVTDEALTQCIRTLRRQLGDDAARPRFIETVPKHGYRFVAPVTQDNVAREPATRSGAHRLATLGAAGTAGAGVAGTIGGLLYGFAGASQPIQSDAGALSVLMVLTFLTALIALIGGVGVAFGIAGAERIAGRASPWTIVGGAVGGMVVGACVKLIGLDVFTLLLARSPGDITGAGEGALLGGAVGLGAWLANRAAGGHPLRRAVVMAAAAGGGGGVLATLLGGRLMAGSLAALAGSFPGSRLRLDPIGAWFGEGGLGPISQAVTGGLEGALFGGCIVGAMMLARRALDAPG